MFPIQKSWGLKWIEMPSKNVLHHSSGRSTFFSGSMKSRSGSRVGVSGSFLDMISYHIFCPDRNTKFPKIPPDQILRITEVVCVRYRNFENYSRPTITESNLLTIKFLTAMQVFDYIFLACTVAWPTLQSGFLTYKRHLTHSVYLSLEDNRQSAVDN